jgi:hypothetical protein
MYVPLKLIVKGDAAATADSIRASEGLFRVGIACELTSAIISVFVVLALYHLFKGINQKHALVMAVLLMISLPISFAAAVSNFAALYLVSGVDYLAMFDQSQQNGLAYLFVRLHSASILIASIFWGLWLFPFGWLVIRSGFIPRFLGVFLWIAGSGYVIDAMMSILLPQFTVLSPALMAMIFLEVPIIFWLLIWGAREKSQVAEAPV